MANLKFYGISGLPEIVPGSDIAALIIACLGEDFLEDGDILVAASKIIVFR